LSFPPSLTDHRASVVCRLPRGGKKCIELVRHDERRRDPDSENLGAGEQAFPRLSLSQLPVAYGT
jgi:hypothetical protein